MFILFQFISIVINIYTYNDFANKSHKQRYITDGHVVISRYIEILPVLCFRDSICEELCSF